MNQLCYKLPLYLKANGKISPIIFRDMELRQLEVLVSIADNGSFSGAARALSTVQSNVSAHISRLEKELATILVERSTGRLTQDGQTVVEHARRVFNQIQDIAAAVAWICSAEAPMLVGQTIHLDGGFADGAWRAVLGG